MAANAHKRGCLHRATVEDGCYGCYRTVYDVVCTGAVLLFAGVVSLYRVVRAISRAISLPSATNSN